MSKTIYSAGEFQRLIVDEIKAPLMENFWAINQHRGTLSHLRTFYRIYKAMQRLPEPTKENTWHLNTHILIDIRDEFFKWESNPDRIPAFRVIWNFVIILYDYDAYYRDRIDWAVEKLLAQSWQKRAPNKPRITYWREFDESMARKRAEKRALLETRHVVIKS